MSTIQAVVGAYLRVVLVISWYFVIIYMQYSLYRLSMLKNLPDHQKIAVKWVFLFTIQIDKSCDFVSNSNQ
jgi:hypothetical protein